MCVTHGTSILRLTTREYVERSFLCSRLNLLFFAMHCINQI